MEPVHLINALILGLALVGYVSCLLRFYWGTLALTAIAVAYVSAETPMNADTVPYWAAAALGVAIALTIAFLRKPSQPQHSPVQSKGQPQQSGRRIVLDGTNVMYWDGDDARLDTLRRVVDYLIQRDISPIVFLDASSRHHLKDTSLTEKGFARALGLPRKDVMVCPAGTEADVFILKFARQEALPILSNDRFGDRSKLAKGIKVVKGVMTDGRPILDGL